ncbi:hypothetical protein PGTUg99_026659 [Puccinia graminis f. sp. tritici]|uniref:Uncharacterized protein n=1 Tax=Puccinia graminis f. sp. tritici TaxID=56615 RepID=A0A5B0N261_PUCGR|nr:hypothetical protein PGTUg99_026659 [Puccinia graminis f. sp. tritici]
MAGVHGRAIGTSLEESRRSEQHPNASNRRSAISIGKVRRNACDLGHPIQTTQGGLSWGPLERSQS